MRIAINIRAIRNHGGIGRYTYELTRHLINEFHDDEFFLFGCPDTDISFLQPAQNWKFVPVSGFDNRLIWESFPLKDAVNREYPDIFHNPDYTVPAGIRCPATVTVHDLSFKYFPKGVSFKARYIYNILTPKSVRRSDLVIADSFYTKDEIVRAGWKEKEKVRVVHLAVNSDFFDPPSEDLMNDFLKEQNLEKDYILYLGAIDKRKNITGLIQAYSELRERHKDVPKLVIAGQNIGGESEIMEWILRLNLGDHVIRIGYIPPEKLKLIYRCAMFFVFPSYYEGFGLPPLEAMACGVPVIVSDRTSLPEVVGAAGIVVPIKETKSLTDSMLSLIIDENKREELGKKGLDHAGKFTWKKVANEVMNVYKEVIETRASTPSTSC